MFQQDQWRNKKNTHTKKKNVIVCLQTFLLGKSIYNVLSLATVEYFCFLGVAGRKRETPGICLLDKLKINLWVCSSLILFDFFGR